MAFCSEKFSFNDKKLASHKGFDSSRPDSKLSDKKYTFDDNSYNKKMET